MVPYECFATASEFGRRCHKCKTHLPAGSTYIRKRNGYGRCLADACGGPTPAPDRPMREPWSDATRSEDEIRRDNAPDASITGQRRRTAGHGFSGGDGFKDM